jgi:hypothetical protein
MTHFHVSLSVAALLLLGAGCRNQRATDPQTDTRAVASADDHHHGAGPHGGTIADWGAGDYHVEFTVDHEKQEATVYLLESDAMTAAPISADELLLSLDDPAIQVSLSPMPLENEPAGMSSRFVGQHEALAEVREFSGTISGEVNGTPYAGDFREEAANHQH